MYAPLAQLGTFELLFNFTELPPSVGPTADGASDDTFEQQDAGSRLARP